jgi:uncharacterized membrane protein YqjE
MFTLSFLCVAIIVSAWNTPYVVAVAWGVAAAWLLISIATFAMMKTQKPAEPLHVLRDEMSSDLEALKDALK